MTKRANRKDAETKRTKAPAPAEPFFRPFQALGKAAAKKKAAPAAAPGAAPKAASKAPATPPAPSKQEREAAAAPMDAGTFAIFMAGVRPIHDRGSARIPRTASAHEPAAPAAPKEDLDAGARERMRALVSEGIRFESLDDGARLEARRIDTDPRELRRLRRGEFAIDARLDLHGLTLEDARKAVEAFVRKRSAEGDKAVAIIHGKGKHSPGQIGVLRGEIGAWLSQGRASRHVTAFVTAPEDEGGDGVLLVLLAR